MRIEKPEDVEVSLTITMTAKQWDELRSQLQDKWPSWQMSAAITGLLSQVRKIVWDDQEVAR